VRANQLVPPGAVPLVSRKTTDAVQLVTKPKAVADYAPSWYPGAILNKDGVWFHFEDGAVYNWVHRTGSRMIEGIASTGTVSKNNQSLNPKGCVVRVPIPLLFRHGFKHASREVVTTKLEDARIGEVFMVRKSKEHVMVRALLDNTLAGAAAWELIESGRARCFSVSVKPGTAVMKGVIDGTRYYDQWEMDEVSVCFGGANPDCHFSIVEGC
jgi:hypothetical protein